MTVANRPTLIVPKVLQDIAARSQLMLARRREVTGSGSAACGTLGEERSAEIVAEAPACAREAPVEPEIASEPLTRLRREYRARMGEPVASDKPLQSASAASSAEHDRRLERILEHAGLRPKGR